MNELLLLTRKFFISVAATNLPGGIPLDVVLHLVIGAITFVAVIKIFPKRVGLAVFVVLAIAVSKELFDLGVVMRNQFYLEPFKDVFVTMLCPLLYMMKESRNKLEEIKLETV